MKSYLKSITLLAVMLLTITATKAQNATDTVSLVVSGQGATLEEARTNALRSAIEQAYGAFISTKTELLNDSLVKDEVVSVASGNIKNYVPISEVKLPNDNYAVSLRATVSLGNLTRFCENKGAIVEFKGGLFAMNIRLQKLNELNEIEVIRSLRDVIRDLADKSFNYRLENSDPVNTSAGNNEEKWQVDAKVLISANDNIKLINDYLHDVLGSISMNNLDIESYKRMNKSFYNVSVTGGNILTYTLRRIQSVGILQDICWYIYFAQFNFIINDGIKTISPFENRGIDTYKKHRGEYVYNFIYKRDFSTKWSIIITEPPQYSESDEIVSVPYPGIGKTQGLTYNLCNTIIHDQYEGWKKSYDGDVSLFADSTTIYKTARGTYTSLMNQRVGPYRDSSFLKINTMPSSTDYANLTLKLIYTTDELSRVTSFSVSPGEGDLEKINSAVKEYDDSE